MKIRNNFVSNSSSSSFIAYGACLDTEEFFSLLNEFFPNENVDESAFEDWDGDISSVNLPDNILDSELCKLIEHFDYDCQTVYIGKSWDPECMSESDLSNGVLSDSTKKLITDTLKYYNLKPQVTGGTRAQ